MQLLRESGLARLTTRKIAERIGFTEGAFFRHFPTKQALLLRLMDKLEEMLLGPIQAMAADSTLDLTERLQRIIGHHIRLVREQDSLPILLLAEASASGDKALLKRMRAIMDKYRRILVDLIQEGRSGRKPAQRSQIECVALGLIGLPAVLAIQHRLHPDPRFENQFEKRFAPWAIELLTRAANTTP